MRIQKPEISTEDILEHWRQGKSTLDWRHLTTIKEKKEWLKACLTWTGLPTWKIKSFVYVMDGNQVNSYWDFYCLLGETFFGYRGYFGQDAYGLIDCFSEIHLQTQDRETVEHGAKIILKNAVQIGDVLKDSFSYIIESLREKGFDIELH